MKKVMGPIINYLRTIRDRSRMVLSKWRESSDYGPWFRGKKVVLVGPNCQYSERDRCRIKDADICIVMNKGRRLAIYPELLRSARSIAYFHCLDTNYFWGGGPLNTLELKREGLSAVYYPLADPRIEYNVDSYHRANVAMLPLRRVDRRLYGEVERRLGGFRPTSGLAIAASLAPLAGCRLYVSGLTFYRKAYAAEYATHLQDIASIKEQMEGHGVHHPDRELVEFIRLRKEHGVEVDEQLEAILSAPYVPLFYTDEGDDRMVREIPQ